MALIYRAANIVEAQLVVDELKAGGMQAHITGSYLSGAIGELPPTEVIGVWLLDDAHRERARQLIDEYERSRSEVAEPRWWCDNCKEWIDSTFGACWQCSRLRHSRQP